MKIAVTGATGFLGKNLIRYLNEDILYPADEGDCLIVAGTEGDLSNASHANREIKRIYPHTLFHFAGLAYSNDWDKLFRSNVQTTMNVLNAASDIGCKVVVVGSAAEYGKVYDVDLPIEEKHTLKPVSPYGLSMKLRFDVFQYYADKGDSVSYARLFNPIGRGVSGQSPIGSFLSQIPTGKVKVGNLKIKRDFIDIKDACSAFLHIAGTKNDGEVYNVCSGRSYMLEYILHLMIGDKKVDIEVDENRIRKDDIPDVYGCVAKLKNDTTWESRVSIEESIKVMMS